MKWIFWVCMFLVLMTVFIETEAAPSNGKLTKNAPGKSKAKAKSKKPSRGKTSKKGRKRNGEEGELESVLDEETPEGSGSGDEIVGPEEDGDDETCMQCQDPCGCFNWGGSQNNARKNAKKRNTKKRQAKKRQIKQKSKQPKNSAAKQKQPKNSNAKSNKKQG